MNYNGPAERLHAILEQVNLHDSESGCMKAWASILEEPEDTAKLLRKIGKVMELPDEVLAEVKSHFPGKLSAQNHWVNPVKAAFKNQHLAGKWGTFSNYVKANTVDFLGMTAVLLEVNSGGGEIDIDQLEEMKSDIMDLIIKIDASEMLANIKDSMIGNLEKVIDSIDSFKITGREEVSHSVDALLGRAFRDESYREFLFRSDLGTEILKKLNELSVMVTLSTGLPMIASPIIALLNNV